LFKNQQMQTKHPLILA